VKLGTWCRKLNLGNKMSERIPPLSVRIKRRMEHCNICHGTLVYMKWGIEMSCGFCSDWELVRREVECLENKLRALQDSQGENNE
jgi:hypothetical protein